MSRVESPFRLYSVIHEDVSQIKLLYDKEAFLAEFLLVFRQLEWFHHEIIPVDPQHQPGLGLAAHLEGVMVNARTDPQSKSLAVQATNYLYLPNWPDLPDVLQNHFSASIVRILTPI